MKVDASIVNHVAILVVDEDANITVVGSIVTTLGY